MRRKITLNAYSELSKKEFGKILDKVDNFYLIGGGAYIFAKDADDFVKVPKQSAEFYNAIGFYHWGVQNG